MHGFLPQTVAMIAASAVIAYVCHRLKILPIVGFLLAGVVIGPHALAIVEDAALIDQIAEIGIVLLLFTIGLEFSLERLWRIKRAIFIGGGLQLSLTIAAVTAILALMHIDWRIGFYTGALVALSSTALVLKVLGDRNEVSSPKGQLTLGILIFQDLAIVGLVLVLPMLAGGAGSPLGIAKGLALAAVIVVVVVLVARRVMPPILERVARTCSQEIFLLTIIAICLGTAWLTNLAGVSLSLGAFLAGLVMSESRFSHHAFAEILPLQILFSAVFFISVGMLLDIAFVMRHPLAIVIAVVAVVLLKTVVTGLAVKLLGEPMPIVAATAFLLAQIGEFSFVLERVGRAVGLYPLGVENGGGQVFIAVTVLLMAMTPLLAKAGRALEERHVARTSAAALRFAEPVQQVTLENHVIVAGYGSGARYLTRVLRDSGVPFVILTLSPTGAAEAQRDGLQVVIGDYSKRMLLDTAAIDNAKMLVIPDDTVDMARRVVGVARGINPTLNIIVRTQSQGDVDALISDGADEVLIDELEIGVQLFTRVLDAYQVNPAEIEDHVQTVRNGGYAALRAAISDAPLVVCEDLDERCFDTRTFTVRANLTAPPITIAQMATAAGVRVLSVDRGGQHFTDLSDDFALLSGDRLTARASAQAFAAAARLLRPDAPSEARPQEESPVRTITLTEEQRNGCEHAKSVRSEITTTAIGCEDCLKLGERDWVHLRICMTCGGVRCCDSSKYKHATAHYKASAHPIIRSYQPGEVWAWCYVDEKTL